MELNHSFYQTEDKDRLAGELYKLRSRRQFCLFEMENESHFQKQIEMRKDHEKMRTRLFFCILIPLSFGIGYYIVKTSGSGINPQVSTFKLLLHLWFLILAIPCVIGWYKLGKTLSHLKPGGKHNVYEADLKNSQAKYNSLMQEKDSYDALIRDKEIEYARATSLESNQERRGDAIAQEMEASKGSRFGLKKDTDYSDEIRMENRSEQKKQIDELKKKIEIEKQKIVDCKHYIRSLEIEYKHARTVIAEFGIGIILIFILQLVSNDQVDGVLAVLAYILIVVFLIMYVRKYSKVITAYNFEQNPVLYKDYAFCNEWVCCQTKERNARKEIFFCEQEIKRIEDKIVQI